MTFSTIPAVKLAVTNALTSAFGTDVTVTYGHPGSLPGIRKAAYVEGTAGWDKDWADLGAQNTDERYTLSFKIVVSEPTATDFQTTTEAAFDLASTAATAIQALTSISGVLQVLSMLVVPGPDPYTEFFVDDQGGKGKATLLDLGVRAHLRLSA